VKRVSGQQVNRLEEIGQALSGYRDVHGGREFFSALGYPTIEPLPFDLEPLPQGAREPVKSCHQLVHLEGGSPSEFRVFHVELRHSTIRRTDVRRFLEAFYRHYPQGNNLFVFSAGGNFDELHFVSLLRILDPRDHHNPYKVRLWLRILPVRRERPYRTDLETLNHIRADGLSAEAVWRRHEEAFSVQRVSEQFFRDYRHVFRLLEEKLKETHPHNEPAWARDYTHQLLNRIMFLYFVARKGWLLGPDKRPDRDFMRHFWEAYREGGEQDAFHREWLGVLFFEAFNNRWQNRSEYLKRFPRWLVKTLAQAPFLNGGLYRHTDLDRRLHTPLPDGLFALLFERWTDGTFPGLFERYNFTVVESGRFDEEVAVDPEMLGTVYERLVNITFEGSEEDPRGQAGIFYTPRTEIDLMCRIALVDWLGNQVGREHRGLIYRWVFAFSEEEKREASEEITAKGLWEKLNEAIRRVRVCDPACGSGSFLVGMMLVLDDLQVRCNAVLGIDETPYERRKRILQDQLYGVDVMDWAVRVAELRLWLQLVVETELEPAELHSRSRPLLPNLDFRIRVGDSIVQEVPELPYPLILRRQQHFVLPIQRELERQIQDLIRLKQELEEARITDLGRREREIWRKEREIIAQLLERVSEALKRRIANGLTAQRKVRQELEALQRKVQEQREKLLRGEPIPLFLWEVAFPEVFFGENGERAGFDIVIANPPYVRHEKIAPPTDLSPRDYKAALNRNIAQLYENRVQFPGRADLYVAFFFASLSLLKLGGVLCFVTSNSWLDVDYGKAVQELLLKHSRWRMVIDNLAKRTFAESDINTVITLAVRPKRDENVWDNTVRFVAFRVPFQDLPPDLMAVAFQEINEATERRQTPEYRVTPKTQRELWLEGAEEPKEESDQYGIDAETDPSQVPYAGNKLGSKYLRAPDIFFTILEKGKDKLVRLGDIAEVRRGFTSGANEFFYLEPVGRTVKEVAELAQKDPMAPVRVKNGAGWTGEIEAKFLEPFLFSLKETESVRPDLKRLHRCVFVCRLSTEQLRKQGYLRALAYIQEFSNYRVQLKHGGECLLPEVPSLRGRDPWYALPEQKPPHFISNRFVGERFLFLEGNNLMVCDVFFVGYINNANLKSIVVAMLNSSLTAMIADIIGRKTYGIGVVYLYGPEINNLLVLNPALVSNSNYLLSAFSRLSRRPIRSIFEELGFPLCREKKCPHPEHPYEHVDPSALTLEQVKSASPDRFELDSVVFDVLGLTDEERLQVYRAVVELVKNRLVKAKSVRR